MIITTGSWPWRQATEMADVYFTPQPDITAPELAEILVKLIGDLKCPIYVDPQRPIPEHLLRHFTKAKDVG